MASKKGKKITDLAPKSTGKVKGGRLATNENLTLVRAAGWKANKHI